MPPALIIVAAVVAAAATKRAADQKAKTIEREEKIARQQAKRERQAGIAEANDFRRRNSRVLATSRALRAGSGVTAAGSPLLVDEATAGEIELGALRVRNARETRRRSLLNQASLLKFLELETRVQGTINAGTSALSVLTGGGIGQQQAPSRNNSNQFSFSNSGQSTGGRGGGIGSFRRAQDEV